MKLTFISIALIFCSLVACEAAFAQPAAGDPYIVPSDSSGELASREIDSMAAESRQSGERLFVIARLGAGEKSRRLNLGRLYNTRNYLSGKSFNQSTIVFAEGERVNGEGRLEFYLGSRLRLVVLAKRNRMPNLTCCDDYFPAVRRRTR